MLNIPPAVRIWMGTAPVDMRRGFDGLAELVRYHLSKDPQSGHVFVFRNKRGDRAKLFYWDGDGYILIYKRLDNGVFHWPAMDPDQPSVAICATELAMLLKGIDWSKDQGGWRYHRSTTAKATG